MIETVIDIHNHLGRNPHGTKGDAEELLRIMDSCGVGQALVFPIDSVNRGETYEEPNQEILRACQKHPDRFLGVCRVQPKAGYKAVREMQRRLKEGFLGVKLHPTSDDFVREDCADVLEAASLGRCPVILHTDHRPNRKPRYWMEDYKKHPHIRFVLTHAGKDCFREAGEMATLFPNVYLDTSCLSLNRTRELLNLIVCLPQCC